MKFFVHFFLKEVQNKFFVMNSFDLKNVKK